MAHAHTGIHVRMIGYARHPELNRIVPIFIQSGMVHVKQAEMRQRGYSDISLVQLPRLMGRKQAIQQLTSLCAERDVEIRFDELQVLN